MNAVGSSIDFIVQFFQDESPPSLIELKIFRFVSVEPFQQLLVVVMVAGIQTRQNDIVPNDSRQIEGTEMIRIYCPFQASVNFLQGFGDSVTKRHGD